MKDSIFPLRRCFCLQTRTANQLQITVFLSDLSPLTRPHWRVQQATQRHHHWQEKLAATSNSATSHTPVCYPRTRPFTPLITPTDPRRTALLPPPPMTFRKSRTKALKTVPGQERERKRCAREERERAMAMELTVPARRSRRRTSRRVSACLGSFATSLTLLSQTPRSNPPRSCLPATTATSRDSAYVSLVSCLSAIC